MSFSLALLAVPLVAAADVSSDTKLTFQARRLLDQDEVLSPYNIGVQVRDGIATLIGRLPTPELLRRAEERVQQVRGLRGLRSELLTGAPTEHTPLQIPNAGTSPVVLQAPSSVVLLAPLAADEPTRPPTRLTAESGIDRVEPRRFAADQALQTALNRLRWTEPRFLRIQVQVQQGMVRLSGPVVRGEDGMDFARLASRQPGVASVLIETREMPLLPGRTP